MTPDEVARHHAERPGYELVDWSEVSLPVYKVYVVASLLQHTPLAPIYEFVLRAIRLGVDDMDGVSQCLGIPRAMVEETIKGLHASEEVAFVPDAAHGVDRFVLTRKGERTTQSLERIRPEQQTIPIFFDGLTRRPIEPPVQPLLSGRQAEDMGYREIPPLPATRIEVADIDLTQAARVLARARSGEGRKDLLAIKSVEKRMRLHMPAVALVFRQVDGEEVELSFASESRLLEDHNRAFEKAEGAAKLRLVNEFSRPELAGTDSLARRIAAVPAVNAAAEKSKGRAPRLTLSPRSSVPAEAVETLAVLDHPQLLWDAVATATKRVMIISPWITSQVVDRSAIGSIRKLLERGCNLLIGYGIDENRPARPVPPELVQLAAAFPQFELRDFGDTHEKVLIKDDDYIVVGSFNWLSFRGDPRRRLRREMSVKINDPAYVEKQFAKLEARFRRKAKADRNVEE